MLAADPLRVCPGVSFTMFIYESRQNNTVDARRLGAVGLVVGRFVTC